MKRASIALRPSTIIPPAPLPFLLSEFFRQRRIGGGVLTGLKRVLRDFTTIGLDCKSGLQARQLHSVNLGGKL